MDLYDHQFGGCLYFSSETVGQGSDPLGSDADCRDRKYAGMFEDIWHRQYQRCALDRLHGDTTVHRSGDSISLPEENEDRMLGGISGDARGCQCCVWHTGTEFGRNFAQIDRKSVSSLCALVFYRCFLLSEAQEDAAGLKERQPTDGDRLSGDQIFSGGIAWVLCGYYDGDPASFCRDRRRLLSSADTVKAGSFLWHVSVSLDRFEHYGVL